MDDLAQRKLLSALCHGAIFFSSPDPPIRLEAPVIHAGEEKRTRGFSRLHPHS
jgi:hypothetical protein